MFLKGSGINGCGSVRKLSTGKTGRNDIKKQNFGILDTFVLLKHTGRCGHSFGYCLRNLLEFSEGLTEHLNRGDLINLVHLDFH